MEAKLKCIKEIFEKYGHEYFEPEKTTEGAINRKETGCFRGLYYIYPEENFYFGKAESKKENGTIFYRHKTHRPKLDVDLRKLYGPEKVKCEPHWTNPKGFREGVAKFLLEGDVIIPLHFEREEGYTKCNNGYGCRPINLDFKVNHIIVIDTLPVLVWNLEHMSEKEISEIETAVIHTIWPYCNHETYCKRKKLQNKITR